MYIYNKFNIILKMILIFLEDDIIFYIGTYSNITGITTLSRCKQCPAGTYNIVFIYIYIIILYLIYLGVLSL